MKDSFTNSILVLLAGMVLFLISWVLFLGCGFANFCTGTHLPPMTSVPTLHAATMPPPLVGAQAVASVPKCHVAADDLIGAWVNAGYSETASFSFTDSKGTACTGTFKDDVQPLFVTPNLWYNGAQACTTCHYADVTKAFKNMDLSSYAGIVAGANRVGGKPKGDDILGGGHWDQSVLHLMLFAPDGKIQTNSLGLTNAMPFGRSGIVPAVPASGPVVAAGSPGGSGTAAQPGATATTVDVARPSNAGGTGLAVTLTGDAASGKQIFAANCAVCHNTEGKGGIPNPGSDDGTVPSLNPIDPTLVNVDPKVFADNLDLFLEHGSSPEGDNPTLKMPAWGDSKKLLPQQIADAIAYVISLNSASAGAGASAPSATATVAATSAANEPASDIARPSNAGGAGLAVTLTGNVDSGKQLFAANCAVCHNAEGKGGIPNPGSDDGTVPSLNPIDPTLVSADNRVFIYNLDLFLEHGSTPEGDNPTLKMPAWGDLQKLQPQQIADLIAYVMSLNRSQIPAATPTP